MSVLYMVATPIGNLSDMTYRAVEVLKEVDVIACEDTRHSARLLNHFGIQGRTISCRARNEAASADGIVNLMDQGQSIAYISDAGTPSLSDPGTILVRRVREAGYDVIPLPGASAFASLLSAAGMGGKTILFDGFLSPKKGKRRTRLTELLEREEAFVLYESPYKIVGLLEVLSELDGEREVFIGREMTKKHEEYLCGSALELYEDFKERKSIKGEVAIIVSYRKKV